MTTTNSLQKCNGFDFDAEHNGVPCIASTLPEDQGTDRQFWFTAKMLSEIFEVTEKTLRNNIESLVSDGEIAYGNFLQYAIPGGNQRLYETTIYNLEVLNKLGMCCFRGNKKAREIRNKFNDVLVEKETKKKETNQETHPAISREDQLLLGVIHAESKEEKVLALKDYKIYRDEQQREIEQERDEAKRTKTLYQAGLASEMSGRVGGLQKANNSLRKENSELKDAVGRGCNWRTVSMMKAEWIKEFGHVPSWQKLKQFSKDVGIPPVQDVEEKVVLNDGSEKTTVSYRYHKEAWARYKKYEENLRVSPDEVSLV